MTADDKKQLTSMSTKELEALHGIKDAVADMAQNLTPDQFSNLMGSKELSDEQKGKLRDSRLGALRTATSDEVKKWSAKDIEQLAGSSAHGDLLTNPTFAAKLSDDQSDALGKKLSPAQKAAFEAARDARFEPGAVVATIGGMSAEKIGKLHPSTAAKPHVFRAMSGRHLAALDPDKFNPGELTAIKNHINTEIAAGSAAGNEFSALLRANPKTKERWEGVL